MMCREATDNLVALLDAELDLGSAEQLQAHLAACPTCAAEMSQIEAMLLVADSWQPGSTDPANASDRAESVLIAALLDEMAGLRGEVRALRVEVAALRMRPAAELSSGGAPLLPRIEPDPRRWHMV